MNIIGQLFKSKTVGFNVLAGAIITILTSFGVSVPVEVVTAVLTLGNFILRLVTNKSIKDK